MNLGLPTEMAPATPPAVPLNIGPRFHPSTPMNTCTRFLGWLAATLLLSPASTMRADNEIGFTERFALATDSDKALGEHEHGSEDAYY